MVGTNLLGPRSHIPSPSSCLVHLLPKTSLLQSDQLNIVLSTDHPGAMSKILAVEVTKKAFKLIVTISQMDEEDELKEFECSIGLIREGSFDPDYCSVRPVTAKHNIANTEFKGVLENFQLTVLRIPKTRIQRNYTMRFPGAGYEYDHHSGYGINIALANVATSQSLREVVSSFEHVRPDFECEAGQKVAIGVYGECGVTPDAARISVDFEELELINGKAD
jgi:hypothetical protein